MGNERLRAAMRRHDVSVIELATLTEKDPKTVDRWLGGRVPHPRQRFIVARHLHDDEEFLWPGASRSSSNDGANSTNEIVASYPYRSNFSTSSWWEIISKADSQIDLLGYTLYFLPLEHPGFVDLIRNKCAAGCAVRAALADPGSPHVAYRDAEEGQPINLVTRIRSTLQYFLPLADCENFELHYQDIPLYNSIFRFDDEMLVTPHLFATLGSSAPLLHVRRLGPEGIFSRFMDHFEGVWQTTTPATLGSA